MRKEITDTWKITRKVEGNPAWKGDKATVSSIHCWIRDNFIKTEICEFCGFLIAHTYEVEGKTRWRKTEIISPSSNH